MTNFSRKAFLALTVTSLFTVYQSVHANYCPRCVKIESERAQHPQTAGYYDDTYNIHDQTPSDAKNGSQTEITPDIQAKKPGTPQTMPKQ